MGNEILRLPGEILFGRGALGAIGARVRAFGVSTLICTDPVIAASPSADRVRESLAAAGVRVTEFSGTEADLPLACVEACLEVARHARVESVVGLGGGSCIDMAKAVAMLLGDPGPVSRFYGENKLTRPVLPVVAVPTTAGTGSEVTPVAVFSDPGRSMKVGVSDPRLVPKVAICDPEATLTCPPGVTGFSGADALVHAVEAYCAPPRANPWEDVPGDVFRGRQELSRHYALVALERIGRALERAYHHGDDLDAREDMLFASLCAGIAFAHAGTACAHALQYPVGAATGTAHGLGVALLLPYTLELARPDVDDALADVGAALGGSRVGADPGESAIALIEQLTQAVGVPVSLAAIGVRHEDLARFAGEAIAIDRLVRNSPRPVTEADLLRVLEAAFAGDRARLR